MKTIADNKPTVLILQAESEDQKYIFRVPPANWLQTDMVERAGGIPVWKDANLAGGWTESIWSRSRIGMLI